VVSRALGLVREMAKSYFFGAGGAVSAFDVASKVPTMLYDQLVGGMLSAALVPVFSDYARRDDPEELWDVIGHVYSILTLLTGGSAGGLLPQRSWIVVRSFPGPAAVPSACFHSSDLQRDDGRGHHRSGP